MPPWNIRQKRGPAAWPAWLAAVALLAVLAGCSSTAGVVSRGGGVPEAIVQEPKSPGPKVSVEGTWSMPDATPEDVQRVKQELLRRYAQRLGQAVPAEQASPTGPSGGRSRPGEARRPQQASRPDRATKASPPPAEAEKSQHVFDHRIKLTVGQSSQKRALSPERASDLPRTAGDAAPQVVPLAGPLGRLKLLAVAEDAQGRQLALLDDGKQRFTVRRGDRLLEPQRQGRAGSVWQVEAIRTGALQLRQENSQRRVLLR